MELQKQVHATVEQTRERSGWPAKRTLSALGIARRSYYRWLKEEKWAKQLPEAPVKPIELGVMAPDFVMQDQDGKDVRLADHRGKVVVLDFWATWCPPCRKEIPGFVNLHNNYQAKGVEVVGVSLDRSWAPVKPFMQEYRINYTIVLGDQQLTEMYGGFTGIPTTFVIDRNGVIRDKHTGYMPESTFEEAVKLLL